MYRQHYKPQDSLPILEALHQKYPDERRFLDGLTHAYMQLGFSQKADALVNQYYQDRTDVFGLKLLAWQAHYHQDNEREHKIWQQILNKAFYHSYEAKIDEVRCVSHQKVELTADDVPLFCVERNEMLRLPYFLAHYRALGVTRFFFVDNNSDDGALAFLSSQPDCYVFLEAGSFAKSGYGIAWLQQLIKRYVLPNQWYLVIDADEFLIYPDCEIKKLPTLIDYMNTQGFEVMPSYVLDMYPADIDTQLAIKSGDNLLEKSPYFYNCYFFENQVECPYYRAKGGIFYYFGHTIPINVTPLLKKGKNCIELLGSRHLTTPAQVSDITSVVQHYKFIGDFEKKAIDEGKRKEHHSGGAAYNIYANIIQSVKNAGIHYADLDKSTRYQDSHQLIELGLMRSSEDWIGYK